MKGAHQMALTSCEGSTPCQIIVPNVYTTPRPFNFYTMLTPPQIMRFLLFLFRVLFFPPLVTTLQSYLFSIFSHPFLLFVTCCFMLTWTSLPRLICLIFISFSHPVNDFLSVSLVQCTVCDCDLVVTNQCPSSDNAHFDQVC